MSSEAHRMPSVRFPLSAITVALLLNTVSVQAQNVEENKLERIAVTAQKRTQNLQDIPVAMTAISGSNMSETVSLDIYDLQGYVPAFSAFQSQSATNARFQRWVI